MQRVRTSFVLGAASATVIAAWLLAPAPKRVALVGDVATEAGMELTARLTSSRILVGDHEQDLAITITAPSARMQVRPPLSLAVVIDRSGSMEGAPIANAKAAAARLIDALAPGDAFSVVAYSYKDRSVVPIVRATDENKAAARVAIEAIDADGGTCISCGLTHGANDLAATPVVGGLRRIVLISDGEANEGIWERTGLAQLAAETATHGTSISTLGVGDKFDEVTMATLAEVGRGNYYYVEDTADLGGILDRELGELGDTVASDVEIALTAEPGNRIEAAYGYPMLSREQDLSAVTIPVADLRAGETRKVVIRMNVAGLATGPLALARVELGWRAGDGTLHTMTARVHAELVEDRAAVAASVDRAAVQAVEQALASQTLEEATVVYEQQGYEAAKQVIDRRVNAVHANINVDPATAQMIDEASAATITTFRDAPSIKAKKVGRVNAYRLAR